jgi:hypothetical protein
LFPLLGQIKLGGYNVMEELKMYYVEMINGQGCVIANTFLYARDEWSAIDVFKEKLNVIEYEDDTYCVSECCNGDKR